MRGPPRRRKYCERAPLQDRLNYRPTPDSLRHVIPGFVSTKRSRYLNQLLSREQLISRALRFLVPAKKRRLCWAQVVGSYVAHLITATSVPTVFSQWATLHHCIRSRKLSLRVVKSSLHFRARMER